VNKHWIIVLSSCARRQCDLDKNIWREYHTCFPNYAISLQGMIFRHITCFSTNSAHNYGFDRTWTQECHAMFFIVSLHLVETTSFIKWFLDLKDVPFQKRCLVWWCFSAAMKVSQTETCLHWAAAFVTNVQSAPTRVQPVSSAHLICIPDVDIFQASNCSTIRGPLDSSAVYVRMHRWDELSRPLRTCSLSVRELIAIMCK